MSFRTSPLSIKKNILIVKKFKKKDIILYLPASETPDVAPNMPWFAGPCSRTNIGNSDHN